MELSTKSLQMGQHMIIQKMVTPKQTGRLENAIYNSDEELRLAGEQNGDSSGSGVAKNSWVTKVRTRLGDTYIPLPTKWKILGGTQTASDNPRSKSGNRSDSLGSNHLEI